MRASIIAEPKLGECANAVNVSVISGDAEVWFSGFGECHMVCSNESIAIVTDFAAPS